MPPSFLSIGEVRVMSDLKYIACILLSDDHGIDNHAWELIEGELIANGITDVSKCVRTTEGRWYITDEDLARLIVP